MFCAISGNVPENPVVSKRSGHLFERQLILKHIENTGRCPITGDELGVDDLLDLTTDKAVKPRTAQGTSIPGLLGHFQNEWDAMMLETHALKQNMHKLRQELSHALYQHDAACRVIARLIKERDDARRQMEEIAKAGNVSSQNGKRAASSVEGDQVEKRAKTGISPEVEALMTEASAKLSKGRKKRSIPEGTVSQDELAAFNLGSTIPLHKTTTGGINSIAFCPFVPESTLVASAGNDSTVQIFDLSRGVELGKLTGHSKKVSAVSFVGGPEAFVTGSADQTVRLWKGTEDRFECVHVSKEHSGAVTDITMHPTGKIFISASEDKTWALYDVDTAECMLQVANPEITAGYTCACFHPDGLILGTGNADHCVHIWEVRSTKNVAKFDSHTGPITSLSFSENGYYLATSAADGVKLWDLRKLKNFKTLAPVDDAPTSCCAFDKSGNWLAVGGGAGVHVYGVKQDWSMIKALPNLSQKGAVSVAWGHLGKSLAVGAHDHNLRLFAQ